MHFARPHSASIDNPFAKTTDARPGTVRLRVLETRDWKTSARIGLIFQADIGNWLASPRGPWKLGWWEEWKHQPRARLWLARLRGLRSASLRGMEELVGTVLSTAHPVIRARCKPDVIVAELPSSSVAAPSTARYVENTEPQTSAKSSANNTPSKTKVRRSSANRPE